MDSNFKVLNKISKKARTIIVLSYFFIFLAVIFAIMGIAVYKKEFIDNPFYFIALILSVLSIVSIYLSTWILRNKAFKTIEKIDVFGNDFVDDLEKIFWGPLSTWNRIIKKIKIINDSINNLSDEELNQLNNELKNKDSKKDKKNINSKRILESERLYVRHFSEKDLETVYKYRNDKQCYQYQSYSSFEKNDLLKMFNENKTKDLYSEAANFALVLKDTNELVGEIFVSKKNVGKEYFIGFTVIPKFQRNGYAFEIISELLVEVAPKLDKFTFFCTVYEQNIKSVNLIKKLEFKYDSFFYDEKGRILVYKKTYN